MIEAMLTPRLRMILSLVPETESCCDIGTDHGYLAIALAKRAKKVIAADINRGPLEAARANVIRYGADNVELRLSDGFSAIEDGEADCAVAAGMGGELIARLISCGTKGIRTLVLQPQSLVYELRKYLNTNGYVIEDEELCREGGRFYVAMRVTEGRDKPFSEAEARVGAVLLRKNPPLLHEWLEAEIKKLRTNLERIEKSGVVTDKKAEYERLLCLYGGILNEA